MFAASAASSSRRALLSRSCRRTRWPSLHRTACAADPNIQKKFDVKSNNFIWQNPSSLFFSTIPFGDDAYTSALPSPSESVADLADPHPSLQHSPTQKQIIHSEISDNSPSRHKFRQQIQHWIETNPKTAPYKAEKSLAELWVEQQDLFRQWEEQREQASSVSPPTILLSTESVNLVLQAWCYSNNGEIAALRSERLLHWMEDFHSSEAIPEESLDSTLSRLAWSAFLPKPNYQSYATVIHAWSQSAIYESGKPSPLSNSNETVNKSGGRSKNVISCATKAGFECAKRAEVLLTHMQRMHEHRLQLAGEGGKFDSYKSEVQPDTRVFNTVLKSWSMIHGGTKASAIRAMRILDLMQELHHHQSMEASEWQGRALSKVQPNLQTYKVVLHAWARATHTVEGPDRAEEILRHMLSLSKAGNLGVEIMPDAECFHIVMKAHAESVRKRRKGDAGSAPVERAQKVTALLDWMEMLALRSPIEVTSETYRIALSAWVWSHHVDAPKEADKILNRMVRACDMNSCCDVAIAAGKDTSAKAKPGSWIVQTETRDFNTVINCCSFARKVGVDSSTEDDESLLTRQLAHQGIFDIAEGALNTLLSSPSCQVNESTFVGIIRAACNLLPNTDDRDDRVIELFRLAYHTPPPEAPSSGMLSQPPKRMRSPSGAGCVDANVLRQLRHALPTEVYIRAREVFEKYRRRNVGEE